MLLRGVAFLVLISTVQLETSLEYHTTLSDDALRYAAEALGETDEVRAQSVEAIAKWFETSKSKFTAPMDATWILSFLRANNFNLEKTKTHITRYLNFRASTPDWFADRDPKKKAVRDILKLGLWLPLKGYDKKGRAVTLIRLGKYNPEKYNIYELMKVFAMLSDLSVKEDENLTVYGGILALDFDQYTLNHALQLTPALLGKSSSFWETFNFRAEGMEGFHMPGYVNLAVTVFKQLLSPKFRNKIHVHPPGVELFNLIPRSILPVEYGGTNGKLQDVIDYWSKKVVEERDWLIESQKYKYNEPVKN